MLGALEAGFEDVVGIEKEREYCEIARARIEGREGIEFSVAVLQGLIV
jgi:hypothetical protein